MRILVAEDDGDMRKIICLYLVKAGYEADGVHDGRAAFDKLCKKHYDCLIADWMMPEMNGIELCEAVRSYGLPVKIIMLTAKSTAENEITGLSRGADDYIKKPFEPQVLLLRLKKLLNVEEVLRCKSLTVNLKTQSVLNGEEEVRLTQTEWNLLRVLMSNKGITLTREQLLERVWGADYDGDERTLDTHIRRLRSKIGKGYITTFVGIGYRMEEPQG